MKFWLILSLLAVLRLPLSARPELDPQIYQRKVLKHQGLERSYYVHLPSSWDGKSPVPLMILLHGGGGSAPQALEHYPLLPVADKHGFILVAANGTGPLRREILRTWNVGFGFGYAYKHQIDDNGFIRSLILQLRKDYPVNPGRVYLTGLSNGAILCHFAGAANSDLVAGIAPVVGCAAGSPSEDADLVYPPAPQHPLDVILFNGALDKHMPLNGGKQELHLEEQARRVSSARQSAEFWVRANGCKATPKVEELPEQKATRYTWSEGRQATQVVLYILHNQGHAWPGGRAPRSASDPPSPLLKAHDILWDFFASRKAPEKP